MLEQNISLLAQNAVRVKDNKGRKIYFDPFKLGDNYIDSSDYIFVTHSHYDHFSPEDIIKIKKDDTKIVITKDLEEKAREVGFDNNNIFIVEPNNEYKIDDISFQTIPAYNTNKDFHKKEYNWVGYIVTLNEEKIYVAGDTDITNEAMNVECDIACVPVGGTYTMTADEAVELIKAIKPKVAIPTHYKTLVGSMEDAYRFKELLKDITEVKILMN